MNRNPTPAQVGAAVAAHDEVIGLDPRPNLRKRHAAMVAALRAAADLPNGAEDEHLQRGTAGR
jgi:pyrimidine deaminase RibD-like protein